jgi:hypothetical protein
MVLLHNSYLNPEQIYLKSSEFTTLHNGSAKSHITFELKNSISIPNNVDAYIQLNSFKFTNAFYNVNSNNNIFYYSLSNNINSIQSVVIAVGQYNITNLVSSLNSALNGSIVLTYNNTTFKITFTSSTYTFIIRTGANNCLDLLGLSSSETSQSSSVTSDKLINLSGCQLLYIQLANIKLNSNTCKTSSLINVLEAVTVDNLIGSSESYYNTTNTRYKISDNYLNLIEVMITDEKANLVHFNSTDWYLNLSIIYSYKFEFRPPALLNLDGVPADENNNIDNNNVENNI